MPKYIINQNTYRNLLNLLNRVCLIDARRSYSINDTSSEFNDTLDSPTLLIGAYWSGWPTLIQHSQ